MPRKQFYADLAALNQEDLTGISELRRGNEDGELRLLVTLSGHAPFEVLILATDLSEYPDQNSFFICVEDDATSQLWSGRLEQVQNASEGLSLHELLIKLTNKLELTDFMDLDEDMHSLELDGANDDDYLDNDHDLNPPLSHGIVTGIKDRIHEDARQARSAGYRVGVVKGMTPQSMDSLLSVSIRVAKLGLPHDTLQAWSIRSDQYVVVSTHYRGCYKTFEDFVKSPATNHDVSFRIGVSNAYKPKEHELNSVFSEEFFESQTVGETSSEMMKAETSGYQNLLVSKSLQHLMANQFHALVTLRLSRHISWDEAKELYQDIQTTGQAVTDLKTHEEKESNSVVRGSRYLMDDHLSNPLNERKSLPLVATQFLLTYLVRCTEFCVVCHEKLDSKFVSLKPYICKKPLCLYQLLYMGFGPSLEHEIISQPDVIDLLVSFCYSATSTKNLLHGRQIRGLREYPVNIVLQVPHVRRELDDLRKQKLDPANGGTRLNNGRCWIVTWVPTEWAIDFDDWTISSPVREGEWVTLTAPIEGILSTLHFSIRSTQDYPRVYIHPNVTAEHHVDTINVSDRLREISAGNPVKVAYSTVGKFKGCLTGYDQDFDKMSDDNMAQSIQTVLNTLPPIRLIAQMLQEADKKEVKGRKQGLASLSDHLSPAAIGLLRWIVATNRSCISQVESESDDQASATGLTDSFKPTYDKNHKIPDMHGFLQFRFAQGTPDKEERFLNSLIAHKEELSPSYPTLFAWHGSALPNWHSIIRTGLDFSETHNGRAYGDGCYHSQTFRSSLVYSHQQRICWPNSELQPSKAICLNEIVNLPHLFVRPHDNPHLVVQHVDWIQCRYLFVESMAPPSSPTVQPSKGHTKYSKTSTVTDDNSRWLDQDPKYQVCGPNSEPLKIPRHAIPTARALEKLAAIDSPTVKRRKLDLEIDESGYESVASDEADMELVLSGAADLYEAGKAFENSRGTQLVTGPDPASNKLAWTPGMVDLAEYRLLEEPSYATNMATTHLGRELKSVQKLLANSNVAELGWWVDTTEVVNMYQWVIEMHSFDLDLQLAKDMQAAGVHSIVLEVRFSADTPNSPPFVRVVYPRFLQFSHGGGGHVTAGGSICMDLLTNSGWSPANTLESVLLQVRMALVNDDPRPARLESRDPTKQRVYGIAEALDAYRRVAMAHSWKIPTTFNDFLKG